MSEDSSEAWKRCRDQDQGSVSIYEKEKTTETNISTIIFVLYIGHWRSNCPMEEILENEA